jgi:hypothetical protein
MGSRAAENWRRDLAAVAFIWLVTFTNAERTDG